MQAHPFLGHGRRGCFINLVSFSLAICAVALSAMYPRPEHPLCRGGLGAGFPVLFICDAGLGGSPISSWGKIDINDIPNGGLRPGGFLLDFLFYSALTWIVWVGVAVISPQTIDRRDLGWAAWISIIYIAGFLCAALVFLSSDLYIKNYARTPTPNTIIFPSPMATTGPE
jgi:hypothetical protein